MLVQVKNGDNVRVLVSRGKDGELFGVSFYFRDKYINITAEEYEQLKEMVDGGK
jgi:hypothetical protein